MQQYVIYLRKSRSDTEAEARGEGETLARHEKALLDLAKRLKLNITEIYKEVVSGETIAARPMMQQLLSEVEKGVWDGVLVMEVERLARGDTIDQGIVAQTFKFSATKIITPSKTFDPNNEFDEEYFEFGLFMSRREYKTINRRLQRGRLASVKEGKYVANNPPYGYDRKKLDRDKGYTLQIIPDQADVIRMIFDWYTTGDLQEDGTYRRLGVSLIVRKLNRLKIKPQKGDAWVASSVRDILINPVYIGKIRWNWRPSTKKMVDGKVKTERMRSNEVILVDGLHEGIIPEETFKLAQEQIETNPPRPVSERNTIKNPLAGIVVCGKCNRKMIRRPYNDKTKYDILMCPATHCPNVSSKLSDVEDEILLALGNWLSEYKLTLDNGSIKTNNAKIEVMERQLLQLENEDDELQKQLNTIYELLEKSVYTSEQFLERSRLISGKIEEARTGKEMLRAELELEKNRAISKERIIPKIEYILNTYYLLPNAQAKNDMLKEVLEKAVYLKERPANFKGVDPKDFSIALFPILPAKS